MFRLGSTWYADGKEHNVRESWQPLIIDEIQKIFGESRKLQQRKCRIVARDLHERVFPGVYQNAREHRMPAVCQAMHKVWTRQGAYPDRKIHERKGLSSLYQGPDYEIEFDTEWSTPNSKSSV